MMKDLRRNVLFLLPFFFLLKEMKYITVNYCHKTDDMFEENHILCFLLYFLN